MLASTYTLTCCLIVTGYVATAFSDAAEVSKCYTVGTEQCCFYTSGSLMSWNEAREYSERKNSTLPIITDEGIDKAFEQFVANDSFNVIQNNSVWLGAYARPLNESVSWHWINGQPSALTSSNFSRQTDNNHNSWYAAIGVDGGLAVLYGDCWTHTKHYVCQYDPINDTSSSMTSNGCSPRWILHRDSAAGGASPLSKQTTQQQCLDFCVRNSTCVSAEWSDQHGCWIHYSHRRRDPRPGVTQFEIANRCNTTSDATCGDTFQVNSSCYKVYKNEKVNWFTAVNRCRSKNASLAVFDDNVRQYFPSSVLREQAWIGLLKSRWTWRDSDGTDVMFSKFGLHDAASRPDNSSEPPNSELNCVVAANGLWKLSNCDERHGVVCQSDQQLPVKPTVKPTTTSTTTPATTTTITTTSSSSSTATTTATTATTTGVNSTTPSAPTGDNSAVGLAVGLAFVFVVVIIVVVVVVVVVVLRRRSSSPSDQHHHQQQQQQLQLKPFDDTEQGNSRDANITRDEEKPEIVYADIVKPTNTNINREPDVIYVNIPSSQSGAIGSSNGQNDNDPVIYSELHACDTSDLYARVLR